MSQRPHRSTRTSTRLLAVAAVISIGWCLTYTVAGQQAPQPNADSRGQSVTLEFVNRTQQDVTIFWVDFNGAEKWYSTLKPDQSHKQPTGVGHRWVVRDAQNAVVQEVTASQANSNVVIGSSAPGGFGGADSTGFGGVDGGGGSSLSGKWALSDPWQQDFDVDKARKVTITETAAGFEMLGITGHLATYVKSTTIPNTYVYKETRKTDGTLVFQDSNGKTHMIVTGPDSLTLNLEGKLYYLKRVERTEPVNPGGTAPSSGVQDRSIFFPGQVAFSVDNQRNEPVGIVWVGYDGKEFDMLKLSAHEKSPAWVAHQGQLWRFYVNGAKIDEYVVKAEPHQTFPLPMVGAAPPPRSQDRSIPNDGVVSFSVDNQTGQQIAMVFVGYDGKEGFATRIENGAASGLIDIHPGALFRFKANGQQIDEYVVGTDVVQTHTVRREGASPSNPTVAHSGQTGNVQLMLMNVGSTPIRIFEVSATGQESQTPLSTIPAKGEHAHTAKQGSVFNARDQQGQLIRQIVAASSTGVMGLSMTADRPASAPSQDIKRINLTINNPRSSAANVFSIQGGQPTLVLTIPPRDSKSYADAREGQEWLVRDANTGEELRRFTSSSPVGVVYIGLQAEVIITGGGSYQGTLTGGSNVSGGSSGVRPVLNDPWYREKQMRATTSWDPAPQDWYELDDGKKPVNFSYSLKGYFLPGMSPPDFRIRGTGDADFAIFAEPGPTSRKHYNVPGRNWWVPNMFHYTRDDTGNFQQVERYFATASERQHSFTAMVGVEGGGMGTKVGVEGSYGRSKSTSQSEEASSVYADVWRSKYWLTLIKKNIELHPDFRKFIADDKNFEARSAQANQPKDAWVRFFRSYGTHYPVSILYGGRCFYSEEMKASSFAKSLMEEFGVAVSGETSISGVEVGAKASYNQSESQSEEEKRSLTKRRGVAMAGSGSTVDSWTLGDEAQGVEPIQLVLGEIHELIRPEFFPDVDPQKILKRQQEMRQQLTLYFDSLKAPSPPAGQPRYFKITVHGRWNQYGTYFPLLPEFDEIRASRNNVVLSQQKRSGDGSAYVCYVTVLPQNEFDPNQQLNSNPDLLYARISGTKFPILFPNAGRLPKLRGQPIGFVSGREWTSGWMSLSGNRQVQIHAAELRPKLRTKQLSDTQAAEVARPPWLN